MCFDISDHACALKDPANYDSIPKISNYDQSQTCRCIYKMMNHRPDRNS